MPQLFRRMIRGCPEMTLPLDAPIAPVVQKHPKGCAIACAAMLCGRSYEQTAQFAARIGIRARDKALYNGTGEMRRYGAEVVC